MAFSLQVVLLYIFYSVSVTIWGIRGTITFLLLFIKDPLCYLLPRNELKLPEVAKDPALGVHSNIILKSQNNLKIKYVSNGEKGKPLMLCIHGFPECWYSWRYQLKEFYKDYWVVAVDMPGYGESDKPKGVENYTVARLTENMAEIIKALGYEKAILVAHDWGGALTWAFAVNYTSMCDKVIIMNAPNSKGFKLGMSLKQYLASWYMFFFQLPWIAELLIGSPTFMEGCFKGQGSGVVNQSNMTREDVQVYQYALQSWEARNAALNYYRANNILRNFMNNHVGKGRGGKLRARTLLIWGTEDRALTLPLAAKSAKMAPELIDVEYVEGASHWVQQDNPIVVNQLMWKFLNQ